MTASVFEEGGYRYVPGVSQYSEGVAAQPGYAIHRVSFVTPLPLRHGFERIEAHLKEMGRPIQAFCSCELRSPEPFTEQGFREFNEVYIGTLKRWGIFLDGVNPVARSNVCPQITPPSEPSLHAFSYTMPDTNAQSSFVVSGSAEAPEGHSSYREVTVALGDLSNEGLRKKMTFVINEMQRRMRQLGFDWPDVTATQVYTVHNFHNLLVEQFKDTKALGRGLSWYYNRPPVVDLEYEMDCRAVFQEHVLKR
ncbi:MAG: hypothetical protein NWS01_02095 [Burkholderiales bacterium]|jgi:hypothetical protein|nr:hypothetical protein [Burkholderiales bacterium]